MPLFTHPTGSAVTSLLWLLNGRMKCQGRGHQRKRERQCETNIENCDNWHAGLPVSSHPVLFPFHPLLKYDTFLRGTVCLLVPTFLGTEGDSNVSLSLMDVRLQEATLLCLFALAVCVVLVPDLVKELCKSGNDKNTFRNPKHAHNFTTLQHNSVAHTVDCPNVTYFTRILQPHTANLGNQMQIFLQILNMHSTAPRIGA